ncbi:MAG: cytochrome c3 family protein [Planctomycetota bacterium]|nr:cytochrome c3 family protein [Planctomycetota bacterium]MDA0933766.1 cytochrome c3 family protein [Planctomycetota bacterium]
MAILGILVLLRLPVGGWIQAPGPATPGHGEMRCAQCHERAEGSLRQQLQATVQHALGMRETGADIGHRPVGDRVCIDCHDRPNDRHPTVRFREARFALARAERPVQRCTGCHLEHQGVRVTAPSVVCQTCHGDLDVRDDPVEPTHADLVAREDWTTCLRCHDFHGNHTHVVAESLADAISVDAVLEHLGSGPRAYGPVTHEARSTPQR